MAQKKIKVIHIITMLEMGGAQGNTLFTVANLDRKRFDVGLICGTGGILDPEAKRIPDLSLRFIPQLVRPVHPLKDLQALLALRRVLKAEKPDIVHTHSSKAGILGRLAARIAGVPTIIHSIHGFGFNPYQKFFVRRLFVFLEKRMARFTDVLIAVSEQNIKAGVGLGIGHEKLYSLIRSGVDIRKIQETLNAADTKAIRQSLQVFDGAKIVLTAGPLKYQKDPVAFVECAGRVAREVPNVVFLWSGDGELRPQVEQRIRELNLQNIVRILGWRKDIPAMLKACDVFILTSLWEGLPRSGVEALIAGKPVVAFSVDGVPEIVKDERNGFLLRPGRHEEFAVKLIRLLRDDALYDRFCREAGRTIDESFDIHFMVRRQEALYQRVGGAAEPDFS